MAVLACEKHGSVIALNTWLISDSVFDCDYATEKEINELFEDYLLRLSEFIEKHWVCGVVINNEHGEQICPINYEQKWNPSNDHVPNFTIRINPEKDTDVSKLANIVYHYRKHPFLYTYWYLLLNFLRIK